MKPEDLFAFTLSVNGHTYTVSYRRTIQAWPDFLNALREMADLAFEEACDARDKAHPTDSKQQMLWS